MQACKKYRDMCDTDLSPLRIVKSYQQQMHTKSNYNKK